MSISSKKGVKKGQVRKRPESSTYYKQSGGRERENQPERLTFLFACVVCSQFSIEMSTIDLSALLDY